MAVSQLGADTSISAWAWRSWLSGKFTRSMEQGSDFRRYESLKGKRFTAGALAAWAARLFYDGAQFNMFGRSFRMPTIGQTQDDPDVCLPWRDEINGKQRKG